MIRTFGSVTGLANQPQGLDMGLGAGENIKSIQRGSLTLSAVSSATATVSAVNAANSFLEFTWYSTSTTSNASETYPDGEITNGTTLTFAKWVATGAIVIDWVLTEYNNVKSKQTGTVSLSATSTNVVISAVNPAKSRVFAAWNTSIPGMGDALVSYSLGGAATTFKAASTSAKNCKWQVIELL